MSRSNADRGIYKHLRRFSDRSELGFVSVAEFDREWQVKRPEGRVYI